MRLSNPLLLVLCLALMPVQGCKQIKEERKHRLLESVTSGYRQAIRWGYYDAALQFIQPEDRGAQDQSESLANVRVTGYEVVRPPVIVDEDKAEQIVRIDYVLHDRQRLQSLSELQQWHYDKNASRWWLTSGMPAFKTAASQP